MHKAYRIKREGNDWMPQWVDTDELYDSWHYYHEADGPYQVRVKRTTRDAAQTWLDEQKKKEQV